MYAPGAPLSRKGVRVQVTGLGGAVSPAAGMSMTSRVGDAAQVAREAPAVGHPYRPAGLGVEGGGVDDLGHVRGAAGHAGLAGCVVVAEVGGAAQIDLERTATGDLDVATLEVPHRGGVDRPDGGRGPALPVELELDAVKPGHVADTHRAQRHRPGGQGRWALEGTTGERRVPALGACGSNPVRRIGGTGVHDAEQ